MHDHSHAHTHADAAHGERRLLVAFALTALTLVAEAVGGWISGSLALLADAGHMLVDAAALLFAWLGVHSARRPADARRSFGYARLEILVGYSNALLQFVLVAWIAAEALMRLAAPPPVRSGTMLAVATVGLLVNAFVLRSLGRHDHDDLNAAGAYLHVLGDLLGSLGAMLAALLIGAFGWRWADPVVSMLVSLLIVGGAWRLLRRSAHVLLEGTPDGIEGGAIAAALERATEVTDVHHVHVWQLAGRRSVATLHARVARDADPNAAIASVQRFLHDRFGIAHATVQIESVGCADERCDGDAH
ncbi:MAG TPA: cation diffusion facilitator family transporter [Dokdonella sp.]